MCGGEFKLDPVRQVDAGDIRAAQACHQRRCAPILLEHYTGSTRHFRFRILEAYVQGRWLRAAHYRGQVASD
jgi:hypothetical protein